MFGIGTGADRYPGWPVPIQLLVVRGSAITGLTARWRHVNVEWSSRGAAQYRQVVVVCALSAGRCEAAPPPAALGGPAGWEACVRPLAILTPAALLHHTFSFLAWAVTQPVKRATAHL